METRGFGRGRSESKVELKLGLLGRDQISQNEGNHAANAGEQGGRCVYKSRWLPRCTPRMGALWSNHTWLLFFFGRKSEQCD